MHKKQDRYGSRYKGSDNNKRQCLRELDNTIDKDAVMQNKKELSEMKENFYINNKITNQTEWEIQGKLKN